MPKQEPINFLKSQKRIFLTGKSATGKSYLSKKLPHKVLELDSVILKLMKRYKMQRDEIFMQVYKNKGSKEVMNDFKENVRDFINKNKDKKIIIEGAISNIDLINELFDDTFLIVYLYPSSIARYYSRIHKRFIKDPNSLPFKVDFKLKKGQYLHKELYKIVKEMYKGAHERYDLFNKHLKIYKLRDIDY